MNDPRWTDETAEVVALAIHVADCEFDWEECRTEKAHARAVREILTALADAGLLVPVDVDRDEQRGVFIPKTGQVSRCPGRVCEHTEEEQTRERFRTFVSFTTPWTEPIS